MARVSGEHARAGAHTSAEGARMGGTGMVSVIPASYYSSSWCAVCPVNPCVQYTLGK